MIIGVPNLIKYNIDEDIHFTDGIVKTSVLDLYEMVKLLDNSKLNTIFFKIMAQIYNSKHALYITRMIYSYRATAYVPSISYEIIKG